MALAQRKRRRRGHPADTALQLRRKHERRRKWLPWLLPVFVWLFLNFTLVVPIVSVPFAIAAIVVIPVLRWLVKRPTFALKFLLVFLPLQPLFFRALPFTLKVPIEIVRQSSYLKELAVVAIVLAGFQRARRERHRLDLLDRFALGFVALGLVFVVVPELLVNSEAGLSRSMFDRLLGFRIDVLYALLFVGARHVRYTAEQLRSALNVFLLVGIFAGALSIWEFVAPGSWNTFVVSTLNYIEAQNVILGAEPGAFRAADDIRVTADIGGGESVRRIGGLLISYLGYAAFTIVVVGMAAEAMTRKVVPRAALALGLAGFGVLATQTRSATLAAAIILAVALIPKKGIDPHAHVRFLVMAGAALVIAVPLAFASGITDRLTGDNTESDESHETAVDHAVDLLYDNPLGTGLATGAGAGQRLGVGNIFVSEHQILHVSVQMGLLGGVLFVGFYVMAFLRALATARGHTGPIGAVAAGSAAGLLGLALMGWYLVPLIDFPASWPLFAFAGAAIGTGEGVSTAPGRGTQATNGDTTVLH